MTVNKRSGPLRVLHFIDNLGPGGKERQLVELLKGLEVDATCQSLVVSMTEGVHYGELLALQRTSLCWAIRRSRHDPRAFVEFHRIARGFEPEVIVLWDHLSAAFAIPALLLSRAAVVNAMIRDAPARLGWRAWSRSRLSFPLCHAVVANSQAGLEAYGAHKLGGARGCVIRNGLDARRFRDLEDPRAVRRRLNLGEAPVVGMVSTFRPWKDQPTLIRAALLVLQQRHDVIFVFVGEGEARATCQALVPAALAGNIRFLGGMAVGVEAVVNAFDIGVLATYTEGMPNAVMECMALGKPVVATDGGGTRELVVDGATGFLVPPQDATRLAQRLMQLLEDPALRQRMGAAGQQRVLTEFSLQRMVEQQTALYRRLAGREAAPASGI